MQDNRGWKDYRDSHRHPDKPKEYDTDFWTPGTTLNLFWRIEQMLIKNIITGLPTYPVSALDFACGTGRILSLLESMVTTSAGIDVSPEMLNIARKRCSRSKIIEGDITLNRELLNEKFDLITSFRFFLNAQPDLRFAALRALRSLLSEKGTLVVNFHLNPISLNGCYDRVRSWQKGGRSIVMSVKKALELLYSNGFLVCGIRKYGYLLHRGRYVRFYPLQYWIEYNLARWDVLPAFGAHFMLIATPTFGHGYGRMTDIGRGQGMNWIR